MSDSEYDEWGEGVVLTVMKMVVKMVDGYEQCHSFKTLMPLQMPPNFFIISKDELDEHKHHNFHPKIYLTFCSRSLFFNRTKMCFLLLLFCK